MTLNESEEEINSDNENQRKKVVKFERKKDKKVIHNKAKNKIYKFYKSKIERVIKQSGRIRIDKYSKVYCIIFVNNIYFILYLFYRFVINIK